MKRLVIIVPNSFTVANLLCGCAGIIYAFNEHLLRSSLCIAIALIADFLDGFFARILNAGSEFGKQFDSLADLVTFGVLPGVILYQLISIGYGEYFTEMAKRSHLLASMCGLLIPMFAAIRLAKFNIDAKQQNTFIGMPTPAVAIFIASFPIILEAGYELNYYPGMDAPIFSVLKRVFYWDTWDEWLVLLLLNPWFYISIACIFSLLMVINLPMFSLKFKNLNWQGNEFRYLFIMLLCLLGILVALPNIFYLSFLPYIDYTAIPLAVIIYILLSFANYLMLKKNEI